MIFISHVNMCFENIEVYSNQQHWRIW